MQRHQISGHRARGLAYAACTMLLWGTLPLALERTLLHLDAVTVTWFRFLVASVALFALLAARGSLPALSALPRRGLALLAIATLFLAVNYLFYLLGLDDTDPATAQVLLQAGPLLLALGGIAVFREPFAGRQWLGLGVLSLGIGVFFAGHPAGAAGDPAGESHTYWGGALFLALAAATWAVYGLAQKQLLVWMPSQAVMLCIYVGCTLGFSAGATPDSLVSLGPGAWGALIFVAANTLVGYGTFAAALENLEASRVSAVIALTPLATLGFMGLAEAFWPHPVATPAITPLAVLGAGVVVAGSLLVALGARKGPEGSPPLE